MPAAIKRVWDEAGGFDLLRVHSLRFIGPGALWARRRFRLPSPSSPTTTTSIRARSTG